MQVIFAHMQVIIGVYPCSVLHESISRGNKQYLG